MTDERWTEIIGHIKDTFEVLEHQTEELDGQDGPGTAEIIIFNGPLGKMKLERITRPVVLDKRTIGSRRIGGDVTVEYKYSDTETTSKMTVYRFDENSQEWVEMEMERGGNSFF